MLQNHKNGINVIGYIDGQFGLGEAVRRNLLAMKTANVGISEIDITSLRKNPNQNEKFIYSVNLIQISLNDIDNFMEIIDPELFQNRYTILFFVWESEYISSKLKANIDLFDEVWTPSTYCKKIIQSFFKRAITVIPHPVEFHLKTTQNDNHKAFFSETKFSFLFIFNYHSSIERKNPFQLIDAFKKAFEFDNNVELIIKTSGAKEHKKQEQELYESTDGYENIKLYDIDLDQDTLYNVINQCDCYVSLHHSEGFGLTLAEAIYLGKPTIGTNYSGNTEFMSEENSFLVDCKKGLISNSDINFSKKTIWAHPSTEDAINKLRFVYDYKKIREEKATKAKNYIKKELSYKTIGSLIENRVKYIITNKLISHRNSNLFYISQLHNNKLEIEGLHKEIKKIKKNKLIKFILKVKKTFRKITKKNV